MMQRELTEAARAAKASPMRCNDAQTGKKRASLPLLALGAVTLMGCVTVNAPDDPIVIELNINIRQEVIYRLAEDAGDTIDENADIF